MILTHWGRVTHICVGKLIIIGSNNGLSPWRRQAIIWTNAEILLIGPLGTNFSEIIIGIQTFLFKKIRSKMSSGKLRPFCLGLNVLSNLLLKIIQKQPNELMACLSPVWRWVWIKNYYCKHGHLRKPEKSAPFSYIVDPLCHNNEIWPCNGYFISKVSYTAMFSFKLS